MAYFLHVHKKLKFLLGNADKECRFNESEVSYGGYVSRWIGIRARYK